MKIRRFYSHNMRTALRQVAEVFGEDAAILSTNKVAGGVEVIAALDYDESLMPPKSALQDNANTDKEGSNTLEVTQGEKQKILKQGSLSGYKNQSDNPQEATANQSEHSKITPISKGVSSNYLTDINASSNSKQTNKQLEWSLDPSLQAMKEELGLMRTMMAEQLKGIAWNRFTEKNPLKAMVVRRLSRLGLNNQAQNLLLPHVKPSEDAECSWQAILALLAKSLPITENTLLDNGGTYALMGPTGVGKTTTIAKLAARFVIKHGCDSVGLISTDNYRITAPEQMATFGRILKVATAKVSPKNPLDKVLKKFSNKKLILIDTAGVSAGESGVIEQLDDIVNSSKPIKKLLLMSATSQISVLQQSLEVFSELKPDGVVITKLDEATSLGEILSVLLTQLQPVFFTTDGQKIPEDIRVARSHHIISKAVWLANKYAKDSQPIDFTQGIDQAISA